jgi:hypothetical protein
MDNLLLYQLVDLGAFLAIILTAIWFAFFRRR